MLATALLRVACLLIVFMTVSGLEKNAKNNYTKPINPCATPIAWGGVFVSSDSCASWTALNTGMP